MTTHPFDVRMPPEVSMKILECLKTIDSKMQSHSVAVAELLEPKSTNEIETLKTCNCKINTKGNGNWKHTKVNQWINIVFKSQPTIWKCGKNIKQIG